MLSPTPSSFVELRPTLSCIGVRPAVLLSALLGTAVLLPALSHAAGLPYQWLLPMHWPVILAGLAYGGPAGLAVGCLSPAVSFALSGMPPQPFLMIMSLELGVYGFLAGWLRGSLRLNAIIAVAVALLAGRLVAMAVSLGFGSTWAMLLSGYSCGLVAAVVQIVVLPPLAAWWVRSEQAK